MVDQNDVPGGGGNVADIAQQPQAPATNVVGPDGELASVPNEQLQAALHPVNGYRLATPEDVQAYQSKQKYGTPGQIAQTAGEAALSTATFGTVPGIGSAEDIRGRQQENPIAGILGGVAPFLIPGTQEGALGKLATVPRMIGEAGEAVKSASGLSGVGAKALQYSAESAIMQGSNEVSKALLKDPDSTVPNVIANEGLAALFGGALGVAAGGIGKTADLWAQKFGPRAADVLADKAPMDIASQELKSGMTIPDSLKDALSGNPDSINRAQVLMKSDTIGGRAVQQGTSSLYDQAEGKTLEALGKGSDALEKAPDGYQAGTDAVEAIKKVIKQGQDVYGPMYDELRSQYKGMPVTAEQRTVLTGNLMKAISDAGIGSLHGSAEASTVGNLFKSIDNIADAEGIKNLNTGLNNAAKNPELQRLAAVVSPVIKDFESQVVQNHLQTIAQGSAPQQQAQLAKILQKALKNQDPHAAIEAAAQLEQAMGGAKAASSKDADNALRLMGQRKIADAAFKADITTMRELGQSLGLGRFKGTNGFLRALDDKAPETIIQRLSNKNRQDLVELLEKRFPEAAKTLRDYHLNDALYNSRLPSGGLNTSKFLNNLLDGDKNPAHIQKLMIGSDAAAQRLSAIKDILNAVPKDGNPSGSAAMIDKLWKGKMGTLAGGAMGIGGGHLMGGVLGHVSESVLREINPFLSYKLLEMRGSGRSLMPAQVKAVMDYAKAAALGHMAVTKAIGGIMNQSQVISPSKVPSPADRIKLDKAVTAISKNPTALTNTAKHLQDSMADHASALTMTATASANYLNSLKPKPAMGGILDSKVKPSPAQETDYHRQLDIAQQPLMVLRHVQDGTLTPKDIATLQACHPGAYQQYKQRLMTELTNPEAKQIPYKTRLSMSMFLMTPLDSTMTPAAIIGAQPLPPQQQPQGGAPGNKPKSSTSSLKNVSKQAQTPGQAADERRTTRA